MTGVRTRVNASRMRASPPRDSRACSVVPPIAHTALEVRSRAEGTVPGPGLHDDPCGRIGLGRREHGLDSCRIVRESALRAWGRLSVMRAAPSASEMRSVS
jgi:hypothetical protein